MLSIGPLADFPRVTFPRVYGRAGLALPAKLGDWCVPLKHRCHQVAVSLMLRHRYALRDGEPASPSLPPSGTARGSLGASARSVEAPFFLENRKLCTTKCPRAGRLITVTLAEWPY